MSRPQVLVQDLSVSDGTGRVGEVSVGRWNPGQHKSNSSTTTTTTTTHDQTAPLLRYYLR